MTDSIVRPEFDARGGPVDLHVRSIRTLRLEREPTYVWIEIQTEDGTIGVGETVLAPSAVEEYLHETVAPYLIGRSALAIEAHVKNLRSYVGYDGAGVETRGNAAVDIALWDLFGRVTGLPLFQLLGGRVRESVRIYNTCAGYDYGRAVTPLGEGVVSSGLSDTRRTGPYDDLNAAIKRPEELAEELLADGISAMKIWPFDAAALRDEGRSITPEDFNSAVEPIERIRSRLGSRMDIMIDFHGLWRMPTMGTIAQRLDQYDLLWLEDPIRADALTALAGLAAKTRTPLGLSETMSSQARMKELFDAEAVGVPIVDVSWCGGISEARRMATLAAIHQYPIAFHDCTGPLALVASSHLSVHLPNATFQEYVRSRYHGWYGEIVDTLPTIQNGYMAAPEGPGLGSSLLPDLWHRPDAHVRQSRAESM